MTDPAGRPEPANRILGAVLAGGRSSRFGTDKALAPAGDRPLGRRVVDALRAAAVDPVAFIGGDAGPRIGVPTVPDLRPGEGPLGGLATAMAWAKPHRVVVVPCDAVLLDAAHVTALTAVPGIDPETGRERAVVATVDGEPRISLACWPGEWHRSTLAMVDAGHRRFFDALTEQPWVGVEVPPEAVIDADTPQELARLLGSTDPDRA